MVIWQDYKKTYYDGAFDAPLLLICTSESVEVGVTMKNFKMMELERFYYTVLNMFPGLSLEVTSKLENMLKDITLPDPPYGGREMFIQELDIWGCGKVKVTWNIEKILADRYDSGSFEKWSVKDLLPLIDSESVYTECVVDEINIGMISRKRKDYIVLAMLPGFPELRVIDGNHRLIEKANELDYVFDCLILADRRVIDYLEPNSKRFIEAIYYINSIR